MKKPNLINSKESRLHVSFGKANTSDIDAIMEIEEESFLPGVVESRDVFLERIITFPDGFILMNTKENLKPIGYICSEIWMIDEDIKTDLFTLGHSIKSIHNNAGNMLYISSMGVIKEYRGYGLGHKMFKFLTSNICMHYPSIDTQILIVGDQWSTAKHIYEMEGFQTLFILDGFFKPNEIGAFKGIVMKKETIKE